MTEFTSEFIAAQRYVNNIIINHELTTRTEILLATEYNEALDHIEHLQTRVQELEAQRRWILVSTPPENNDDYLTLTTDEFGDSYQEVAQYIDGFFFDQFDDKIDPTYWQHLPQPPQEGE